MFNSIFTKLLPDETPIKLISQHAELIEKAVSKLPDITEKYFNNEDVSELANEISRLESEADKIKFELRKLVNENIKTTFGRNDLKDYIHTQDDIIDMIEDLAKKMALNRIEGLDEEVKNSFKELINLNIKAIEYLRVAIEEMKVVFASSFSKKASEEEEKEILNVEKVEGEIDRLTLEIGKWIYSHKKDLNCVDLVFFREMVQLLSDMADYSENTAEKLRNFIIR